MLEVGSVASVFVSTAAISPLVDAASAPGNVRIFESWLTGAAAGAAISGVAGHAEVAGASVGVTDGGAVISAAGAEAGAASVGAPKTGASA